MLIVFGSFAMIHFEESWYLIREARCGMEIIESSGYYQLLKHPTSKRLLVVCSSLDTRHPKFTFWKVAQKLDCNCLFLNSPMTHWYRTGIIGIEGGPRGVARKISEIRASLGIEETIFFGVSMGAYGAILFGSLSQADHVIAFSVEPLLGVPGGRTEVTRNQFQSLYPDLRVLRAPPKISLVYGEMDTPDTIGAYLLAEAFADVDVYCVPYAEHDVANSLNYRRQLVPVLRELIERKAVTNPALKKTVVSREVYEVVHRVNNDYLARNWRAVLGDLERNMPLISSSLLLTFMYAVCSYKLGQVSIAKEKLLELLERERECPHAWNLLSSCEFRLKLYNQAVVAAEFATSLKPQYSLFHMTHCNALLKLGREEEAYRKVKISGMLNPRHNPYIDEINRLAKVLGYQASTPQTLVQEKESSQLLRNLNEGFDNARALSFDLHFFHKGVAVHDTAIAG